MDFAALINYDLQKDYIDKLTDKDKLDLFRSLDDAIQDIADKKWNSEENYTEEFMIKWISDNYADEVLTAFNHNHQDMKNGDWDMHHELNFWFNVEFTGYEKYKGSKCTVSELDRRISFLCPSFFRNVPEEYLICWAIYFYGLTSDAKFIESMSCTEDEFDLPIHHRLGLKFITWIKGDTEHTIDGVVYKSRNTDNDFWELEFMDYGYDEIYPWLSINRKINDSEIEDMSKEMGEDLSYLQDIYISEIPILIDEKGDEMSIENVVQLLGIETYHVSSHQKYLNSEEVGDVVEWNQFDQ